LSRFASAIQIVRPLESIADTQPPTPTGFAEISSPQHAYEVRQCSDKRGVDLISNALPFGRLCYREPNPVSNAVDYAKHRSRSHDAVIRVYDPAGNVFETHEHAGDFREFR
jgi:hypothetical protein